MARPALGFISFILVTGGIVFQLLVILSGGARGEVENRIYFLQSTTDGIPNARNPSRWTFWSICGVEGEVSVDCGARVPALPFSPPHRTNFNTESGVPEEFIGTKHYYLLSRFMFVFYFFALLFAAFAFMTSSLAMCTRIGAWISAFNTFIAFFWQTLAACMMTAWTVEGRDVFRRNNQEAKVGVNAYAFTWTAAAVFFLATITFCIGGTSSRHDHREKVRTRRGFFGRRRSRKVEA